MKSLLPYILITAISVLWAADNDPLAGRGAPYLRMGIGSRAQAMGNAHVAVLEPTTVSAYWNPAMSVMHRAGFTASTGYRFLSLGRRQGFLSFASKVPPRMGYSLALLYHGDNDIPIFDSDGNLTYEGSFLSLVTHIAVSYKVQRRLSLGINTTIHSNQVHAGEEEYNQIDTWELGNIDIAAFYRLRKYLAFGLNIKEIKSSMMWEAPTYGTDLNTVVMDTLPVDVKLGTVFSHTFKGRPYSIACDMDVYLIPQADTTLSLLRRFTRGNRVFELHLGAEVFLYPEFPIRLGIGSNEGFSCGVGFYFQKGKLKNGKLDYVFSIEPNGSGLNNGVSWSYSW
jgi:hypothetical protein